ncbi:4-coumarate--CoA ligase 1 [Nasonia vitripennis]|uniref:Luciferin 4-monooxygenase n=1 Tax=Nasonia vitripennis TaxID=7425 RepID=A0A7M7IVY5_NASVI|nr:4-coumarate--CoA ligase 1 [Nasonia vitripennis]
MSFNAPKRIKIEDFVIEDNIIKGVDEHFDETHSIGEHLLATLSSKPQHVAQIEVETGKQTTFAEMKDRSVRCGIWLKKQGVGSNDIVVICSKNNLDVYAPFFATFYAGGTFAGWNPFMVASKPIQHLMKLFKPKIIFAGEDLVDALQKAAKLENVEAEFVVFGKHSSLPSFHDIIKLSTDEEVRTFRPQKINPQDNGLIVQTSGSTGFPKGVVHPYKNLLPAVGSFIPYCAVGDVVMWYSTCDWVTGIIFTLRSVLLRNTRIMHTQFEVEETCRIIEKYKVNRVLLSHIAMGHMLKTNALKRYDLHSLKLICSGGSKVSIELLQGFRDALPNTLVLQVYGLSESGRAVMSQTENAKSVDSIGFVTPCNQAKIVDINSGKTLGANQPGEICIKSPIMMTGYLNNPEATKEVLDDEGWLHTGDKGFYDEAGEFFIIERIKEMMKYQNFQISPTEIEEVLASHPGVMEVAVVPLPHPEDIDRPMAFVKIVPGSQVTEGELVNLSASVLGEIKKLRGGVKFLENLPKTASGKINRPVLKETAKAMAAAR